MMLVRVCDKVDPSSLLKIGLQKQRVNVILSTLAKAGTRCYCFRPVKMNDCCIVAYAVYHGSGELRFFCAV